MTHVGPDRDDGRLLRPAPAAARSAGAAAATFGAEMETAAIFLLAMRERAKGRPGPRRDDPDGVRHHRATRRARTAEGEETWFRPPEDEVTRRVDLTIGAALKAAAALGRG